MRFDSVRMSVGSIFTNILTVRTTASAGIAFSLEAGQPRDSPEPSFNIESHYYLIQISPHREFRRKYCLNIRSKTKNNVFVTEAGQQNPAAVHQCDTIVDIVTLDLNR